MNPRQRFHEIMRFNPSVPTMKWEFGYWGGTVDRWYEEGLLKKDYPNPDMPVSTPTSSLYLPAWNCLDGRLSKGTAIMAGGLYWPSQGFPLDQDVRRHFQMDPTQRVVDVNLLFCPVFDVEVVREDENYFDYVDLDGVMRCFEKKEGTIPASMKWPITSRADWEKIKEERMSPDMLARRFPENWDELVGQYTERDYPLALGGYPQGFFGTVSHVIGYENVFMWYYTEPDLMHDILNTFTNTWLAVFEEVLSRVEIDHWQIWEDISFGKGSMVSLDVVREFMLPYIRRIADFLKGRGVDIVLLDTDGDCNDLIPLFMEAGVTGMYPFEAHCGMDVTKVRGQYPDLAILGGIPKAEIAKGPQRIDEILEGVPAMLQKGGYVPFGDHFIPPDVSLENFAYYRNKLNAMIDALGK